MGRDRKTYSETFKKEVAIDALQEKKTVAEIATERGISPSMVTAWKKAFVNGEFSKELSKVRKGLEETRALKEQACTELGKKSLEIEISQKRFLSGK